VIATQTIWPAVVEWPFVMVCQSQVMGIMVEGGREASVAPLLDTWPLWLGMELWPSKPHVPHL
jgi:hypothetical protein